MAGQATSEEQRTDCISRINRCESMDDWSTSMKGRTFPTSNFQNDDFAFQWLFSWKIKIASHLQDNLSHGIREKNMFWVSKHIYTLIRLHLNIERNQWPPTWLSTFQLYRLLFLRYSEWFSLWSRHYTTCELHWWWDIKSTHGFKVSFLPVKGKIVGTEEEEEVLMLWRVDIGIDNCATINLCIWFHLSNFSICYLFLPYIWLINF